MSLCGGGGLVRWDGEASLPSEEVSMDEEPEDSSNGWAAEASGSCGWFRSEGEAPSRSDCVGSVAWEGVWWDVWAEPLSEVPVSSVRMVPVRSQLAKPRRSWSRVFWAAKAAAESLANVTAESHSCFSANVLSCNSWGSLNKNRSFLIKPSSPISHSAAMAASAWARGSRSLCLSGSCLRMPLRWSHMSQATSCNFLIRATVHRLPVRREDCCL